MLIEMHAHPIYGVDDGAQTREEMERLLYEAADAGVEHLFCTSHIAPGEREFPMQLYKRHFMQACRWCERNAPQMRLYSAAEIRCTPDTRRMLLQGHVPAFEGSDIILLEFIPRDSRKTIEQAVRALTHDGWRVILAHVERYRALNVSAVADLREETGVYVQMNARTVFEEQPLLLNRYVRRLLDDGCVDFVSSDAHSPENRPFCLQYAHHWLKAHIGADAADALCGGNFAKLYGM